MSKKFASHADLAEKTISFDRLSENAYAYTAEGDPNTGIIIGDDAVMVLDTQATPVMAQDVIRRIREVTDKPVGVGLGVSNGAQAREVAAFADAVIVGSALVRTLLDAPDEAAGLTAIRTLAEDLRSGVERTSR